MLKAGGAGDLRRAQRRPREHARTDVDGHPGWISPTGKLASIATPSRLTPPVSLNQLAKGGASLCKALARRSNVSRRWAGHIDNSGPRPLIEVDPSYAVYFELRGLLLKRLGPAQSCLLKSWQPQAASKDASYMAPGSTITPRLRRFPGLGSPERELSH